MIIAIQVQGVARAKAAIQQCKNVLSRISGEFIQGQENIAAPDFNEFRLFMRTALKYGMLREVEAPKAYDPTSGVWIKTRVEPELDIQGQSKRKPTGGTKQQGDGSMLSPKFNHSIAPPVKPHNMVRVDRTGASRLALIAKIEDAGGYDTDYQLDKLRTLRELRA